MRSDNVSVTAYILIEGNRVLNWRIGIEVRVSGVATVSRNEVVGNVVGIDASGGKASAMWRLETLTAFTCGALKFENNSAHGLAMACGSPCERTRKYGVGFGAPLQV